MSAAKVLGCRILSAEEKLPVKDCRQLLFLQLGKMTIDPCLPASNARK